MTRNIPPLFLCLLSFSFFLHAVPAAAEFSRPSTVSQPRSTDTATPSNVRNPATTPAVQRQSPATRLKSGFCLVDGAVEKLNQQSCSRKRGQFFPDQKSAQKAADAIRGYCCKDGEVKKTNQGSCRRSRGEFFAKESDGVRKCAASRGFCCAEGKVLADAKGNCDRKKGQFFIKKQLAETECGKQKGYCCKDATVIATTQKTCSSQRGTFSLHKNEAQRICDRENGYCCTDGTVSRMTLANCNAKKGQFFSRQIQAQQACNNERGFCCLEGKITASTRGVCVQKKGKFSLSRVEIAKTCSPKKSPATMQTAAPASGKTTTVPGKQKIDQGQKNKPGSTQQYDLEEILGRKTISQKPGSLRNSVKGTQPGASFGSKPASVPGKQQQVQQGLKSGAEKGFGDPWAGDGKGKAGIAAASAVTAGVASQSMATRALEDENIGDSASSSTSTQLPNSTLRGIKRPLQVVYIKDRMVRIGDTAGSSGVGSSLTVKNSEANFLCSSGSTVVQAEMAVNGGTTHTGLAAQLVGQKVTFVNLELQSNEQFTAAFCQQGKKTVHQSTSLSVEMSKICKTEEGEERPGTNTVDLPMSVICDLRADADPAEFSPNHPSYNINAMAATTSMINPSAILENEVQAGNVEMAAPVVQAPSPAAVGIDTGEVGASLNLKYTSAMVIGDELFMGTQYQSVHEASPVNELKSNIELDVSCGIGEYQEGTLWIKKASQLQQLQSISSGGKQNLTNVPLMSKADFLADNCAAGTTYHNLGRNIEFLLEYKCNMPGGSTRFEKVLKAPVRMEACDRRNGGTAQETYTAYEHTCPPGYHVQSQGPGTTTVFMSTPVPVTCAKTL